MSLPYSHLTMIFLHDEFLREITVELNNIVFLILNLVKQFLLQFV